MDNFVWKCPTRLVFGKDVIGSVADYVKTENGTKVLMVYGGGSIKKSGVYKTVTDSLNKAGIPLIEASYPIYHKSILNQSTSGVRGAVEFVSNYLTTVKQDEKEKSEELYNYLKQLKGQKTWQEHSSKRGQVKQLNLISELASKESI